MRERDGFVLIAVIFITGLLAITTTAFVANVRSNTMFARALLYNQKLQMAADGMARLIAFQFSTHDPSRTFTMRLACRWDEEISVHYEIQDQTGLVDLNTANPELLVALLRGLNKSEAEAKSIASAINDYKDPDTQAQDGGPEIAIYSDNSIGPSNGPFATTEELDRIPVINEALYKSLVPLTTVHSQQTGIDVSQAPAALIQALGRAGIGRDQQARFASPSSSRVYAITASATRKSGSTFTRETIISLTGQPDKPFAVLKWTTSRPQEIDHSFNLPMISCIENRAE